MLLSVYTRHSNDCTHKEDRLWKLCNCPKWIQGSVDGTFSRWSAKTRSWHHAEDHCGQLIQRLGAYCRKQSAIEINASQIAISQQIRISIAKAVDEFLVDARSRGLAGSTISKLNTVFRKQFLPWCKSERYRYLDQLDHDALAHFRDTWKDGNLSKQKKQHRLSRFFRACIDRGYLEHDPVQKLSKIKVICKPTIPFTREEFDRIIAATYRIGGTRVCSSFIETNRVRLRTMVLLLRWSGLRIRDAVMLERNRLRNDSLFLYQAKTGVPVYVPIPPKVVEALRNLPPGRKPNPRYFFWSGNGEPKSAVANWQRSMRSLFALADIRLEDGKKKRCHPHMFRDTFAVEFLLAGIPIDQVSLLLGHTSIKITERSYAPFVKERQLQLQESVRNAWKICQAPERFSQNGSSPITARMISRETSHGGWRLFSKELA